jgi:hypothetical protein
LVSATLPLLLNTNKTVVAVPTMGDSITEGTIVEWIAQVGQAVRPDDVVALIETDKVTVEIKANVEGVITQHFGAVYVLFCFVLLLLFLRFCFLRWRENSRRYILSEAPGVCSQRKVVGGFETRRMVSLTHNWMERLGNACRDDTVEVGAQLYEIDTEAEASVAPAELVEASGFPPAVDDAEHLTSSSPKAEAAPSADAAPRHRIPSIHFLQKEGWAKRKAGSSCAAAPGAPEPSPATATPGAVSTSSPLAVTTYEVDSLPPSYGRPKLSHAEMDALVYGGANLLDAQ